MRGEYNIYSVFVFLLPGSPPHARGIPCSLTGSKPYQRFTPACAGNTRLFGFVDETIKVHPRMRGEYPEWKVYTNKQVGSPPHARGILSTFDINFSTVRFTPACAGNTKTACKITAHHKVHPRMRGEYKI